MAEIAESRISQRRAAARVDASAQYVEKRRQLVQAAAQVFRERGFDSTDFRDIAAALGINRATLYYYVSSKDELFREVVLEAVQENVEAIESIRAADADPNQKMRRAVSTLMRSYSDNYPYLYVYVQEDMARISLAGNGQDEQANELVELGRRYQDALVAIIEEGVASGAFDAENPRLAAFAIIGMLNWTHRWYKPTGPYSTDEITKAFATIALNGLTKRGRRASKRA